MRKLLALTAVLSVVSIPSVEAVEIHSEPTVSSALSLAQGRWFAEREVHRWARYRDVSCRRLSSETVACTMQTRSYLPHNRWRPATELVEYTGAPVRIWLAGAMPLTPAETEALGL